MEMRNIEFSKLEWIITSRIRTDTLSYDNSQSFPLEVSSNKVRMCVCVHSRNDDDSIQAFKIQYYISQFYLVSDAQRKVTITGKNRLLIPGSTRRDSSVGERHHRFSISDQKRTGLQAEVEERGSGHKQQHAIGWHQCGTVTGQGSSQ